MLTFLHLLLFLVNFVCFFFDHRISQFTQSSCSCARDGSFDHFQKDTCATRICTKCINGRPFLFWRKVISTITELEWQHSPSSSPTVTFDNIPRVRLPVSTMKWCSVQMSDVTLCRGRGNTYVHSSVTIFCTQVLNSSTGKDEFD